MITGLVLFFLSPLLKWVTVTYVVGAIGIALFFLAPAWVSASTRLICLYVGIGAFVAGSFYWYAFHAGEQHMAQRIAAKDAAAVSRVNDALKGVEDCNGGIDWDVTTGTCNRKTP